MSDPLNGIATFVQAVEAGSFALAAERMHLSRSAVGKTIARLEQRLGVHLFQRTTRRQSLTDDGQAYYEHCVRALAELDTAKALFDSGRREPVGRLRVSVPVLFGRQCAAPILLGLTRTYSQLSLEIAFSDRPVDLVEEGFDLAIRIGQLPNSATLAARRLGTQHMAVCAASSYLAAYGRPECLEDLAGHTGIVYCRAGNEVPWRIRDQDGMVREPRIASRVLLDDLQAIADAAVASTGLAWLPCWMLAGHVKTGALEIVMDSNRVVASDIHAIWPKTRYLASKTRVAIDALVDGLPAYLS